MMETFASRKIVLVFCLFFCIVLNDLSVPVHSSESSQTMTVEEFGDSKEDGGSPVEEAAAADSGGKEGGLGVPHHHHHHHHHPNVEDDARVSSSSSSSSSSSRGSAPEVSDDDVEDGDKDGDGDGDGDGGEEQTVKFSAAISERKTQQQPTPCRRHRRAVTFDTITTPIGSTTLHYNPHTATFTAPFSGLYLFSVNVQHRHNHRRPQPDDVHIVAALPDTTQTICSISAQNGDTPDLDSVSVNSRQENVEYRDDLNFAKWGFEDESRRNMDWSRPPRSAWKRNLETRDVEGFCEGVQHLRQGQEVFVRLGNLHEGLMEGADDTDVSVDNKENVCDITGGLFSGSLLTRDI